MAGQVLRQALPPDPAAAAPPPWANPYQAGLDAATAAYNAAPQSPTGYSPEEAQARQDANRRASKWGLLGLMMGDEGQQKAGGQVLHQAMAAAAPRVTDKGTYDPISGKMTVNPEFARQDAQTRMERLQDLAARAQEGQLSREDQQAFQRAQLQEQLAGRLQQAQLQREGINAQKAMALDMRKNQMAGQMYDDWQKVNKQDLDIRNSFANLSNTPPGAEGDVSFIYQYMKMLDPGSVVREGEFATAQNAAGVPDRVRNMWNQALHGARLNPSQRAEMLATAGQLNNQADLRIGQKNKHFVMRATKAGLDPSLVIPEYGATAADADAIAGSMPGAPKPAAPPGGGAAAAPMPSGASAQSGARPRVTDAASYAALPSGAVYIDPNGKTRTKP